MGLLNCFGSRLNRVHASVNLFLLKLLKGRRQNIAIGLRHCCADRRSKAQITNCLGLESKLVATKADSLANTNLKRNLRSHCGKFCQKCRTTNLAGNSTKLLVSFTCLSGRIQKWIGKLLRSQRHGCTTNDGLTSFKQSKCALCQANANLCWGLGDHFRPIASATLPFRNLILGRITLKVVGFYKCIELVDLLKKGKL